jgi:hypothetical protein
MSSLSRLRRLIDPFKITDGRHFRLKDHKPGDTLDLDSRSQTRTNDSTGTST